MAITSTPSLQPGGWMDVNGKGADINFVSTVDLLPRDVDPKLWKPYANKFSTIMTLLGMKKPLTMNKKYEHYEAQRLMPKVVATWAGASTPGGAATFTVTSSDTPNQRLTQSNYSPYVTTAQSINRGIPVRQGDILLVKPSSGLVTAGSLIPVRVQSVSVTSSPAAWTFTAAPLDGSTVLDAQVTASQLFIPTNAQGEQSGQVSPLIKNPILYTGQTQIIKHRTQVSGTLDKLATYASDGKTYTIAEEADEYEIFDRLCSGALLFGNSTDNVLFDNTTPTTPLQLTKGLVTEALDSGTIQTYNSGASTPYGVPEIEELAIALNAQNGAMENFMFSGIQFQSYVSAGLIEYFKNGGMVSLAAFGGNSEKQLALDFKSFVFAGYTFHMKDMEVFNDYQAGGAAGYNFKKECLVTPASFDNTQGWAIRKRYVEGREMEVTMRDLKKITGEDAISLDFQAEIGMEVIGTNKLAYITISA